MYRQKAWLKAGQVAVVSIPVEQGVVNEMGGGSPWNPHG